MDAIPRILESLPDGCTGSEPHWNCTCNDECMWGPEAREYYGAQYVVMLVYGTLSWNTLIALCIYQLYEKRKQNWNTAKTLLAINLAALALVSLDNVIGWIVWAGETQESEYVVDIRDIMAIRAPQILWTTAAMVLVLFWAEMLRKARKFTKYRPSKGLNKKIYIAIGVLLVLEIPVHIAAVFDYKRDAMWNIGNAVLGFYMLTLSLCGFFYGLSLSRVLSQMQVGKKTARSREMVSRFKILAYSLSSLGTTMLLAVLWHIWLNPRTLPEHHIRYWWVVLTQEILGASLLVYAVHSRGGAKKGMPSTHGSTTAASSRYTSQFTSTRETSPPQSESSLADSSGCRTSVTGDIELRLNNFKENDTPVPPADRQRPSDADKIAGSAGSTSRI